MSIKSAYTRTDYQEGVREWLIQKFGKPDYSNFNRGGVYRMKWYVSGYTGRAGMWSGRRLTSKEMSESIRATFSGVITRSDSGSFSRMGPYITVLIPPEPGQKRKHNIRTVRQRLILSKLRMFFQTKSGFNARVRFTHDGLLVWASTFSMENTFTEYNPNSYTAAHDTALDEGCDVNVIDRGSHRILEITIPA